jgi:3-phosphoshikimate 1-carboxyvinyltransferase
VSDAVYMVQPLTRPPSCTVRVPGSKSITNRALLLAALADGESTLDGALWSDDTRYMVEALRQLGIAVQGNEGDKRLVVRGCGGIWPAKSAELFVGNAGTAMRFLVAAACLGRGRFRIDGSARMRQRPIQDLLDALAQLGARCSATGGCPPVTIEANGLPGGHADVAGNTSSQFLSALMMAAPYAQRDVEIELVGELIAQPYVQLTQAVMRQFGVTVDAAPNYRRVSVRCGQHYQACAYTVEADASSAHYFLAAAALTGGTVRVDGIGVNSIQQEHRGFAGLLGEMGAVVEEDVDAITVTGSGSLHGIAAADMNRISDTAPTLAVLASFADSPTRIHNIAHIRHQESDRIAAVTTELRRLGGRVEELADGWLIEPAALHGGEVDTYDDHRIAMGFSLIGLKVPGVVIRNPACVEKTFPDFFARLEQLRVPPIVVAIDGPAGAGKSTVSRRLAHALAYRYIDTGAMYRVIGVLAAERGIDLADSARLAALCDETQMEFLERDGRVRTLADGRDVSDAIRTPAAAQQASKVSAVPIVRERLVARQRVMGSAGGVVMEGRDIGTVVFPQAPVKGFLEASAHERARRRAAELYERATAADIARITRDIAERDSRDRGRAHSPLRPAADAVVIDTTDKTIDDVVATLQALVRTRAAALARQS